MARPRQFDPDEILHRAMCAFWQRGYRAVSIEDLETATGVRRASLYAMYDNKRSLFRAALRHYLTTSVNDQTRPLRGSDSPLSRLRSFFASVAVLAREDDCALGCLLVNTAVELGASDAEIARETRDAMARLEAIFRDLLAAAAQRGEISAATDVAAQARLLRLTLTGMRVEARVGVKDHDPEAVVDALFRPLVPAGGPVPIPTEGVKP